MRTLVYGVGWLNARPLDRRTGSLLENPIPPLDRTRSDGSDASLSLHFKECSLLQSVRSSGTQIEIHHPDERTYDSQLEQVVRMYISQLHQTTLILGE